MALGATFGSDSLTHWGLQSYCGWASEILHGWNPKKIMGFCSPTYQLVQDFAGPIVWWYHVAMWRRDDRDDPVSSPCSGWCQHQWHRRSCQRDEELSKLLSMYAVRNCDSSRKITVIFQFVITEDPTLQFLLQKMICDLMSTVRQCALAMVTGCWWRTSRRPSCEGKLRPKRANLRAAEWKNCHLGSGGVRFDGSKNRQLVVNFPAVWGIPKACGWCSPPRFREGWIQRHRSQTGRPSDRARSVWDLQETPWRAARGPRIAENVAWSTLAACRGSLRFQLPEFVMTLQRKHLAKTIRDNYPLVLEHFNIIIFDRSKSKSSSLDMFITRAIFYSYVSQNQRVMSTLGCPLDDQRGPKSPVLDGLLGVLL